MYWEMPLHLLDDAVVEIDVHIMARHHRDQFRAGAPGLADVRSGFDAKLLRLLARRDRTRRIGVHRHHCHRLSPQRRVQLLLHTGKKAVQIEEQPFEGRQSR